MAEHIEIENSRESTFPAKTDSGNLLINDSCCFKQAVSADDRAGLAVLPKIEFNFETKAARPEDPVQQPSTMPMLKSLDDGNLVRLFVPVNVAGITEHVVLDTGTARTWFRMTDAKQEWSDDAFNAEIGGRNLSVVGRDAPPFNEVVDGRDSIGTIGMDLLRSGPVDMDLQKGQLTIYPPGQPIPGVADWPTMPIEMFPSRERGLMVTEAMIDGKQKRLLIDTGAPTTMLIGEGPQPGDIERTAHDVQGKPFQEFNGKGSVELIHGSEKAIAPVTRAPSFPHFEEVARAMGVQLDGILGLSSLGQRRIIIDVAAGLLRIQPASPTAKAN